MRAKRTLATFSFIFLVAACAPRSVQPGTPAPNARQSFFAQTMSFLQRLDAGKTAAVRAAAISVRSGLIQPAQGEKVRDLGVKLDSTVKAAYDQLAIYIAITDPAQSSGQSAVLNAISEVGRGLAEIEQLLATWKVKH
jgi:hypothetical protein